MKQLQVLLNNQLKEGIRSFKLWVILLIFIFLGILSPALAKLTPVIMENILPENAGFKLPEITALDSWQQFFKNVGQMGLIVFLILFLQLFWEDIQNGSLVLFLTKGLKRSMVIFSKWFYTGITWSLVYGLAFVITSIYTSTLFKEADIQHLFLSVFCLWLFGVFLYTSAFFAAMWTESFIGGLVGAGFFWLVGTILTFFPKTEYYSPVTLLSKTNELLTNPDIAANIGRSIGISVILVLVMFSLTVVKFQKKEF